MPDGPEVTKLGGVTVAAAELSVVSAFADVLATVAAAGVWVAAGVLAEALPGTRTADALRRRAQVLSVLVAVGTALLIAVPVIRTYLIVNPFPALASAVPAGLAALVWITALPRLRWMRRGAAVFAHHFPAPPALRAAAAHPLVGVPVQATALAAVLATPLAAGIAVSAGVALTFGAVTVLGLAVRHALRHSRLAEGAVRLPRTRPRSA